MFKLQEFIVTNPKGQVEFLSQSEYLKRMLKLAALVKNNPDSFNKWAKKRGIPVPIRQEGELVAMSSEHLKAYLTDNGFKFEEL